MEDNVNLEDVNALEKLRLLLDEDLSIDKYNLHEVCAYQPGKYMYWANLYGKAETLLKRRESKLERVTAKLDLSIRRNPSSFSLPVDRNGHPKETAIKSVIALDKGVKKEKQNFFDAFEVHSFLKRAVRGMDQRKQMIKMEGELWRGEYYSEISFMENEDERDKMRASVGKSARERKARRMGGANKSDS